MNGIVDLGQISLHKQRPMNGRNGVEKRRKNQQKIKAAAATDLAKFG